MTSNGYNMASDASCTAYFTAVGDHNNLDALLEPLQDNGGLTPTMAVPNGSPAISLIPPDACALATDQRGQPRPQGGGCEPGAFESSNPFNNEAPVINYYTATPTLTWTSLTDAKGYEVQIATDGGFVNVVFDMTAPAGANTVTPPPLANGLYYWRVRGKNTDGVWGAWSYISTFVVDAP